MLSNIKIGSLEWVKFEDWLSYEAGKYHDWTIIAELEEYPDMKKRDFGEYKTTLSYLARIDSAIKNIFQYDTWDVEYELGNVTIEDTDEGIICKENLGSEGARVFITRRPSIGRFPATWELWVTFLYYFDLRKDDSGNFFDPTNEELIVEVPYPAIKGPVRIRTEYLQDYLAARKMVLIRQHEYHRLWKNPIAGVPEHYSNAPIQKEIWGCYRLDVFNKKESTGTCFSQIRAKDLVTPFERAGTVGINKQEHLKIEDCPEFIIKREIDGTIKKQKPDSKKKFLAVYFNPRVLKRYYNEPSRYTVRFVAPGLGTVSFLGRWNLTIGRNDEGIIITWLGDLLKEGLPYEEIVHWYTNNIPPRGGIADDFYKTSMGIASAKKPSIERRLIDCKKEIMENIKEKGYEIYKPYTGPDRYTEKCLRTPLFKGHTEFRETILLLSKAFIENLNLKSLRDSLTKEHKNDSNGKPLGPIVVFSNFLEQIIKIPKEDVELLKKALQNIQMVRSKTGVAHRFSEKSYQNTIKKLGMTGPITIKKIFYKVAKDLAAALEKICLALNVHNNLSWIKYAND